MLNPEDSSKYQPFSRPAHLPMAKRQISGRTLGGYFPQIMLLPPKAACCPCRQDVLSARDSRTFRFLCRACSCALAEDETIVNPQK
jgi:hypothetical protein